MTPRNTAFRSRVMATLASTTLLLGLAACTGGSVADGSTEPVDLEQFNDTSDRFTVMSTLGEPTGSVAHDGRRCDIYRLYTSGLGAGGKAAVKGLEVLTSVATLGLAQIIWAPVRAGTRPKQHTVLMCYAANDKLVEIFDKNPMVDDAPEIRIVNQTLYSQPVAATAVKAENAAQLPPAANGPITLPAAPTSGPTIMAPPPAPEASPIAAGDTPALASAPAETATRAIPMAPPAAGTIGLNNVSREAIDGPNQVHPGTVVIPGNASADDLNTLSSIRSQRANAPAMAVGGGVSAPTTEPSGGTP